MSVGLGGGFDGGDGGDDEVTETTERIDGEQEDETGEGERCGRE